MTTHEVECAYVLEPQGDLYQGIESDEMERAVLDLALAGRRIIVDLSGVHHLTARGLGILAHGQVIASGQGGFIVLCRASASHRWLLDKTGLSEALMVTEDRESALSRVGCGPSIVRAA